MTSDHPSLQQQPNGLSPRPNPDLPKPPSVSDFVPRGTIPVSFTKTEPEWTGQKWEYCHRSSQGLLIDLNALGMQGWELVSANWVSGCWYYDLKRPIPKPKGNPNWRKKK